MLWDMNSAKLILGRIALVWSLTLCTAHACWIDIPLEDVVQGSPLVVVGEIKRIKTAPRSRYAYDTAFIKVERILKNSGLKTPQEAGEKIPLAMPSINNRNRTSTDIRYQKGQRGVWILEFHKGKFWATYPKDFQDVEQEKEIVEIIKRQAAASIAAQSQKDLKTRNVVASVPKGKTGFR